MLINYVEWKYLCIQIGRTHFYNTAKTRDSKQNVIFYLTLIDCVRNPFQIFKNENVNRINDAHNKKESRYFFCKFEK